MEFSEWGRFRGSYAPKSTLKENLRLVADVDDLHVFWYHAWAKENSAAEFSSASLTFEIGV